MGVAVMEAEESIEEKRKGDEGRGEGRQRGGAETKGEKVREKERGWKHQQ